MILDLLQHSGRYGALGERIAAAFDFLTRRDTPLLEPPAAGADHSLRIDIRGDEIFALVQRYPTKTPTEAFWEAHRKYIDVQCVMEGAEIMGHAPLEFMDVLQPYNANKDYLMLKPRGAGRSPNFVTVAAGMFAVFMPQDAHMPGLKPRQGPREVKKIVVKVRV